MGRPVSILRSGNNVEGGYARKREPSYVSVQKDKYAEK
jgi:hypothetical protein